LYGGDSPLFHPFGCKVFYEVVMDSLLLQLRKRRTALGVKQHEMPLRIGMSRQQYQRLESHGNPSLNTLELIAKGLKSELMLIPQEKLGAVKALLAGNGPVPKGHEASDNTNGEEHALANDPWQDLLDEDK
jgi:transcriptional regulator with XRE-family HTH domain